MRLTDEDVALILAALGVASKDRDFCTQTGLFKNCEAEQVALASLARRFSDEFNSRMAPKC